MPRAVVFDLDYTLAVPTRDRATLLSEATTVADAPSLSREEYLAAHRRNLTRETREPIFADLLAELETDADPAAVADAYRETIADALEPLPGVESMLADLRGSTASACSPTAPSAPSGTNSRRSAGRTPSTPRSSPANSRPANRTRARSRPSPPN